MSAQSYAHHTRWDPPFHFFVLPVFSIAVIIAIVHFCLHIHHHPVHGALLVLLALAALIAVFKIRLNALKVQDRIIRLEERLRLASLLPTADVGHIDELTIRQLIALRFASDAELPALAHRALTQDLEPKAIKQSIVNWRADNYRV